MLMCVCESVFNYEWDAYQCVCACHTLMYTAYYCAVCPVDSQRGVEENGKKGCASRLRYSLRGVLINESHLSNLRLLLCRCTFTVLQSASQPRASLPHWHNMAQGVGAVTTNRG